MNVYYDKDADPKALQGKKVAVIGYGSQGHAHAQNLKDSGVEVCVGLRQGSSSWQKAAGAGLTVKETLDAATWGDIVMVLVPDEVASGVFDDGQLFVLGRNVHECVGDQIDELE